MDKYIVLGLVSINVIKAQYIDLMLSGKYFKKKETYNGE
jgi:hypothetical protein